MICTLTHTVLLAWFCLPPCFSAVVRSVLTPSLRSSDSCCRGSPRLWLRPSRTRSRPAGWHAKQAQRGRSPFHRRSSLLRKRSEAPDCRRRRQRTRFARTVSGQLTYPHSRRRRRSSVREPIRNPGRRAGSCSSGGSVDN